jgi:FMN-dependent oxidoreductase (nitrilotriacetate monooxygenase family)
MAARQEMKLGFFFAPTGHHTGSWRHPDAQADAGVNFQHYVETAQKAEAAKFDMMFLADSLAVREGDPDAIRRTAVHIANIDPVSAVTALAAVTKRIGLVATASTSYSYPYQLARQFASLDHISHGRAGWNIVTSTQHAEARNFGREFHFDHDERYERAREFTSVVLGLWDSWDDDAFVRDKASGIYSDLSKVHPLNHKGRHFSVKGPLNVPRSPQGYPVLIQAGVSEEGRGFAAELAEVVFTSHLAIEPAQAYYRNLQNEVAARGRPPSAVKMMPGLIPVIGRTDAEATEKLDFLNSLTDVVVARDFLSMLLRTDMSKFPLDEPVPDLEPPQLASGSFHNWINLAKKESLTVRQLALRAARGRVNVISGSCTYIADYMEEWVTKGACDGFNIMPPYIPGAFDDFVTLVVPELQRRGLFRREYEGTTLRENLGLARPACRHARTAELQVAAGH